MAESIEFYNSIKGEGNELQDWSLEKLSADPTGGDLYEGRIWKNTIDNRIKYYSGGQVKTVAISSDFQGYSKLVGGHDASTGIPTTGSGDAGTIVAGDRWYVSAAGTIVGIEGDDNLTIGDMIVALVDGANSAAGFLGAQKNLDDAKATYSDTQTANLVADTDLTITANFNGRITSIQVYKSNGKQIKVSTKRGVSPNQIVLHSNRNLNGVVVDLNGFAN